MGDTANESDEVAAALVAVRAGEPGALDELVRRCLPIVARHARRYAWSNTDADDLAQEVVIRLLQHADAIREPKTLCSWLAVVTRRTAAEIGHRNARLVPTELADDRPSALDTEDEALRRHDCGQISSGVQHALDRLDESDRTILLLLHSDSGPGYREVSRQVRRPVGSLGPTRQRLLRRLRVDPAVQPLRALATVR